MERPMIGIVPWPCEEDTNKIFSTSQDVHNIVARTGGAPISILPIQAVDFVNTRNADVPDMTKEELETLREIVLSCDAIIKPGCNKICKHDSIIYSIARENNIPYLGICGGMQLMRNDGVPYVANIANTETKIEHFVKGTGYAHTITIVDGSKLQQILQKDTILVNSKHYRHIPDKGAKDIGAYACDGVIEALEDKSQLFNIGVQWHPELMPEDENTRILFDAFIESARQYKKENHKRVF